MGGKTPRAGADCFERPKRISIQQKADLKLRANCGECINSNNYLNWALGYMLGLCSESPIIYLELTVANKTFTLHCYCIELRIRG